MLFRSSGFCFTVQCTRHKRTTVLLSKWSGLVYNMMRGTSKMKYPILTLNDDTEFVHSQMLADGSVEVYIEKPDATDGFHNASCYLPSYRWENINGFTEAEIATYQEIIESMAHLIIEFSRTGGFQNPSSF